MAKYINLDDPDVTYSHNAGNHEVYIVGSEAERIDLVRCGECKHKPYASDWYNPIIDDGFEIIFPDYRCPCQCEDGFYNRIPDDDWFCGNGERRADDE